MGPGLQVTARGWGAGVPQTAQNVGQGSGAGGGSSGQQPGRGVLCRICNSRGISTRDPMPLTSLGVLLEDRVCWRVRRPSASLSAAWGGHGSPGNGQLWSPVCCGLNVTIPNKEGAIFTPAPWVTCSLKSVLPRGTHSYIHYLQNPGGRPSPLPAQDCLSRLGRPTVTKGSRTCHSKALLSVLGGLKRTGET